MQREVGLCKQGTQGKRGAKFRPSQGYMFTELLSPAVSPKSLTFTVAHHACLISINTPLYDKHVYLLTANITQSDATRCCFSNEDTGAFIKAVCVPLSEICLFYTDIKKHLYKEKKPNYLL